MNDQEFDEAVEMLRSRGEIYEDGFRWLHLNVDDHLDRLVALMLGESDPEMRSKFAELLGYSRQRRVVPLLKRELRHEDHKVRMHAWAALRYSPFRRARTAARKHRAAHPDEPFF